MLTPINAHLINSHLGLITSTSIPEEEEDDDDEKDDFGHLVWYFHNAFRTNGSVVFYENT